MATTRKFEFDVNKELRLSEMNAYYRDGFVYHTGGKVYMPPILDAYERAWSLGLIQGKLVVFDDDSKHLGVVIGYNTEIDSMLFGPERYPVTIQSQRGIFEYSETSASVVEIGSKAFVQTREPNIAIGPVTDVKIKTGEAFFNKPTAAIEIADCWYDVNELLIFKLV